MSGPYRAILSKRASTDLQSIYDYIAKDSPDNAAGMIDQILKAVESLELFPHRTLVEHGGGRLPVRSLPVKSYVVFFRVNEKDQSLRILRVRHGARQRLRRF